MGSERKFKVGQKVQINKFAVSNFEVNVAGIIKEIKMAVDPIFPNRPYRVAILQGDYKGQSCWVAEDWLSELAEEVKTKPSEFQLGQRVTVAGYGLGTIKKVEKNEPRLCVEFDNGRAHWCPEHATQLVYVAEPKESQPLDIRELYYKQCELLARLQYWIAESKACDERIVGRCREILAECMPDDVS